MSLPERDGDGYLADMSEWTEKLAAPWPRPMTMS